MPDISVAVPMPQPVAASSDDETGSPGRRAGVAAAAAQRFYHPATGLFCTPSGNCWWWSANELTALIDYSRQMKSTGALADIATTYTAARYLGPQKGAIGPFLDTWNDDDGWWGLAWVDAYDYAKIYDPPHAGRYLTLAENIFDYMAGQWDATSCGGGLWQNQKPSHTKDAIANELFLSLAASLYRRDANPTYRDWALREWTWFSATAMVNSNHLVVDHLAPPTSTHPAPCTPQGDRFWTYNQGVILGGLTNLYQIIRTTHPELARIALAEANKIADCVTDKNCGGNTAISKFPLIDSRGILTEACGTNPCTYAPSYQFKGAFIRNLAQLNEITGKYTGFLAANALSVWTEDRNSNNLFGFYWDTPPPFYLPVGGEPALQGAALDALNTQLGTSHDGAMAMPRSLDAGERVQDQRSKTMP
ncbi:MAG: glycoside hydrolase family 76 protein [Acidobacteriaceae bacterium]